MEVKKIMAFLGFNHHVFTVAFLIYKKLRVFGFTQRKKKFFFGQVIF